MKVDYLIIPECYVDTALIETIAPPENKRGYNHQMGCNKVGSIMENKLNDCFALGIVDKDKRSIKYLEQFDLIIQKENLLLFKHKQKPHFIIQISPAIEKFILDSARNANLNMEDYGLDNNLERLMRKTKKATSKNDLQLIKLFKDLNNKNVYPLLTLSNWITYLKKNTYNSKSEELKNL